MSSRDLIAKPSRREALALTGALSGAAAAGLAGFSPARAQSAAPSSGGPKTGGYDYSDPVDNMHATAKLMGDLTGAACFFHAQGRVFGMMPDEHARPILGFEG